jgi:hypothetical protein
MTEEDRQAFRNAVEQAKRRLPKGHKLDHVRWHDGVLQFTSRGPQPEQDAEPSGWKTLEPVAKRSRPRGLVQAEFDL